MNAQSITTGHAEDILHRLKAGEPIQLNDPQYGQIQEIVNRTLSLSSQMNSTGDVNEVRNFLSAIIGKGIDESTTIFAPLYVNFGRFIQLGKNVFINHACSFLDMGGITIEDDVLTGPRVNLTTENHPLDPSNRRALVTKPIVIKRKAWIGAGATILAGVTIGENSIVAAGAIVSKDVPGQHHCWRYPSKIYQSN